MLTILGISGSLRKASYSKRVLQAIEDTLGADVRLDTFDIGELPHFNQDSEGDNLPGSVKEFVHRIQAADGLFIVTPEYNYAIPGVLKNAIDWASRPAHSSALAHKPTATIALSPGAVGGARALANLRQVLAGTLNDVLVYPEFLVARVHEKFSEQGLTDASTQEHLKKYLDAFVADIEQKTVRPSQT